MKLKVFVVAILLSLSTAAWAFDRHVLLVNHTDQKISRFYASRTSTNSWEEDILGRRVLYPGERIRINLDDGSGSCYFDFKTVMENGEYVVREHMNICELEIYTITDE